MSNKNWEHLPDYQKYLLKFTKFSIEKEDPRNEFAEELFKLVAESLTNEGMLDILSELDSVEDTIYWTKTWIEKQNAQKERS